METVFEKPLNGEIGNLTNLTTTAKTDLVSAVNEVKGAIPAVINNLTSDSTTSALSAAQGKSLNSNLWYQKGTSISSGSLDSILTNGSYNGSLASVSGGPSGITGGSFNLKVFSRELDERKWQLLYVYDSALPLIYYRVQNGATSFTDWQQFALNSKTNSKVRYLENTSKTDITLLSEDFANIPTNDVTFYRINPTGAYVMGSFIKYNSQSGSGVFTTYAGKTFQISNNSGTWSKTELALKSDIAYDWNSFTNYVSSLETGANAAIYRFGKVRTILFQGIARTHTEDEILATLPENDRPPVAVFTSGNIGSDSVVIRVAKDGKITLYALNGATANARIYFGITYIVG